MLLAFDQVKKTYSDTEGEIEVLRGVNFEITSGKTIALTGESGECSDARAGTDWHG